MSALDIPCPKCSRLLRLPDRTMLGRKARCGKCGHTFVLEEPVAVSAGRMSEPVDVADLVRDLPAPKPFTSGDTLLGMEARWVPDQSPPGVPSASKVTGGHSGVLPELLTIPVADSALDPVARVRAQRLQRARQRKWTLVGAVVLSAVGGLGYWWWAATATTASKGGAAEKGSKTGKAAVAYRNATGGTSSRNAVGDGSERAGQKAAVPITLQMIPQGARIVVHLRPAELWRDGGSAEEFRACLGPLATWIEKAINTHCLLEPAKIAEATFGFIPVSRDAFDVAVVVRTVSDVKKSELIEKFDGELVDKPRPHYVGDERAYLIFDTRTFAIAPKNLANDLLEAADNPSVTSEGIQALLSKTDRSQHFTLVCELEDVRNGVKSLAADNAQALVNSAVDFFGDDVETVAWSMHLGDEEESDFVSEVLVRNKLSRTPVRLQEDLKKKLAELPAQLLQLVYLTNPASIGHKKVIGRFPAMAKVVQGTTDFSTGNRLVAMHLELPERAGPNLALGSILTWNQTTLPTFGKSSVPSAGGDKQEKLPDTIAERLQKKISVDFTNEFLFAVVQYIADETGTTIILDGPGMGGITKNMRQDLKMEDVPATAILHKMLSKLNLVLVVDEAKKVATITGAKNAEDKNMKVFPLEPASK